MDNNNQSKKHQDPPEKSGGCVELDALLQAAPLGVALLKNRVVEKFNKRLLDIFGYADEHASGISGLTTSWWYEGEDEYERVGQEVYPQIREGRIAVMEAKMIRRCGEKFVGRIIGKAVDPANPDEGSVWMVEDVTAAKNDWQELALARKALEESAEAMMITDSKNIIVKVNKAFEEITGWSRSEALGQTPKMLSSGRHGPDFFANMWGSIYARGRWEGEIWDRRKDGTEYPKWLKIDALRDEHGEIENFVALFSDISELKEQNEKMEFLATHDPLTGLFNRTSLEMQMNHALARSRRAGSRIAALFIDLDNFKAVNDTAGHSAGDELLRQVSSRLESCLRDSDLAARIGGDEFAVILEDGNYPQDAVLVANKIIEQINRGFEVQGKIHRVGASIGIAISPDHGETPSALLIKADAAMYGSKGKGKNTVTVAVSGMESCAQGRALMARAQISKVLGMGLLEVSNVAEHRADGSISWNLSPVLPGLSEDGSGVQQLGHMAGMNSELELSFLEKAAQWLDEHPGESATVRISGQTWRDKCVEGIAGKCVGMHPGIKGRLRIALSESSLANCVEEAYCRISKLREFGVKVRVTEYMGGCLSMGAYAMLCADEAEYDMTWSIDQEEDVPAIIAAKAALAAGKALGLPVCLRSRDPESAKACLGMGFCAICPSCA